MVDNDTNAEHYTLQSTRAVRGAPWSNVPRGEV